MCQPNMSLRNVLERDDFVIYSFSDQTSSNGRHQLMEFDAKWSLDETRVSHFIKDILRDYSDSRRLMRFEKLAKPQTRWQITFVMPLHVENDGDDSNDAASRSTVPQQRAQSVEETSTPAPVLQEMSQGWHCDSEEDGEEAYADADEREHVQQQEQPSSSLKDEQINYLRIPIAQQQITPPPAQPFHSSCPVGRDDRDHSRSGIDISGGNGGRAQRTRRPTIKTAEAENRQKEICAVRELASAVVEWQNAFNVQYSRMPLPVEIQQRFEISSETYKKVATRIAYVKRSAMAAERAKEMQEGRDNRRRLQSEPVFELAAAVAERLAVVLPDSHSHQGGVFCMASMGGGDVSMAE